ncbi:hypothetical protein CARUB_v10005911mg [Capsella rubella]|uniref:Uncharacterized protein n=1 Tax=Capsella rubella TaxID=81985 RepID=R0F6V3_9BRAS|nr:hypothetical protein CARUB_v10005911mg [Capsella rubella]
MFISNLILPPSVEIETASSQSFCQLCLQGYNLFWAYPSILEPTGISMFASGKRLSKSLLEEATDAADNTLHVLHQDEFSSPWFCYLCSFPLHSFEEFTMYRTSDDQLRKVNIGSLTSKSCTFKVQVTCRCQIGWLKPNMRILAHSMGKKKPIVCYNIVSNCML